jgi:hypothetical protein
MAQELINNISILENTIDDTTIEIVPINIQEEQQQPEKRKRGRPKKAKVEPVEPEIPPEPKIKQKPGRKKIEKPPKGTPKKRGPKPKFKIEKIKNMLRGRPVGSRSQGEHKTEDPEYFHKYYYERTREIMAQPVGCVFCKSVMTLSKLKRHMDNAKYCLRLREARDQLTDEDRQKLLETLPQTDEQQ